MVQPILSRHKLRLHGKRRPEIRYHRTIDRSSGEVLRRDPNDGKCSGIQPNRTSENPRIAFELTLPRRITNQDHWVRAGGPVLLCQEPTAPQRADSETGEVVR